MGVHWRFLWFVLISFSLLYQGIYFGVLSAVKSVIGGLFGSADCMGYMHGGEEVEA